MTFAAEVIQIGFDSVRDRRSERRGAGANPCRGRANDLLPRDREQFADARRHIPLPTNEPTVGTTASPSVVFANGACTNGNGGVGAFSGAALASQALSDLAQSSSEEGARAALGSVSERREAEQARCPAGFARVRGACEPVAPKPEPVAAPSAAAREVEERVVTRSARAPQKTRRNVTIEQPAVNKARIRKARVYAPAPAAPVVKGPAPAISVEPDYRFGVWSHAFGGYEKQGRDRDRPVSLMFPPTPALARRGPR